MEFDYIVVGGGSAGCVTAGRLVRDFDARVLLLEAGSSDSDRLIHIPAGFSRLLTRPSPHLVSYSSPPQVSLGNRSVTVEQANVLGGGSSVNAMTYTRGAKTDYDGWDASLGGASGWSWNDLLPHFIKQEANQRLGQPFHGIDGPLKVSDLHHPPTEISRSFLLTLQQMGLPFSHDINAGDPAGATYIQSTTFRGSRWSAARAFLTPIRQKPKLSIKFRSPALRLVFDGNRATGVEFAPDGSRRVERAIAREEIILAAGSYISAKLLMLSGIGPAATLQSHGISVRSNLSGVGRNMQDHNDARLSVRTTANYGYSGEDRGLPMLRNGLQYYLLKSGPATSTGSEVTAFLNPIDKNARPTIQLYCMGLLYPQAGQKGPLAPGVTLIANLVGPKSRGSMSLRSADPKAPPIINPNWLSHPDDMKALVGGVKFLLDVVGTKPFAGKVAEVLTPGPSLRSDSQLEEFCRNVTSTNWHPVGSCRMGRDNDPDAVLDTKLRVRGVTGVRVFDGSMMPTIISANTNAPIMAIADRGVDLMMNSRHVAT
jgi:choline dehydrogenase-like flavoprotein